MRHRQHMNIYTMEQRYWNDAEKTLQKFELNENGHYMDVEQRATASVDRNFIFWTFICFGLLM